MAKEKRSDSAQIKIIAHHLRQAQIIWDGPDESDKSQADIHLTAAVLLSKQVVRLEDISVTVEDAQRIIDKVVSPSAQSMN